MAGFSAKGFLAGFIFALALFIACNPSSPRDATPVDTPAGSPSPRVTEFVQAAQFPVALAFAPDGRLFYNELRSGRVRIVRDGQLQPEPFVSVRVVQRSGYSEHGLLGLAVDPDFARNRYVYIFFSVPAADGATPVKQQLVRYTEVDGKGTDPRIILDDLPVGPSCCHNGGRLAFGPDGKLYVSLGDAQSAALAQDLSRPNGKILRINPDGSIPSDNPFPGSPVFALGLRNPFGLAFDPATGELLATENGPSGRDEVNIIRAGGNYGWPEVMGQSDDPRFLPPIYATAQQSIAPTGITVYSGNLLPFQGDAFFCTFNTRTLLRIPAGQLAEVRSGQRRTLEPLDASQPCVLDITTGPDGALYFSNTETIYRWG